MSIGLPLNSGLSSCSTAAKNASMSAWTIVRGQDIFCSVQSNAVSDQTFTLNRVEDFLRSRPPKKVSQALIKRRAAVALILRYSGDSPEILLMKRAHRDGDRWSGQISMPGGREEEEDESIIETSIRETEEELGVDLHRHGRYLGRLDDVRAVAKGKILAMSITPCVFVLESEPKLNLGDEADDAFWLPLSPTSNGSFDSTYELKMGPASFKMPSWEYKGHTIWGLTYKMLGGFIEHLKSR